MGSRFVIRLESRHPSLTNKVKTLPTHRTRAYFTLLHPSACLDSKMQKDIYSSKFVQEVDEMQ